LPKNFKDNSKLEEIEDEIEDLEYQKMNTVISDVFNGDMVVISCGRFIKFGKLDDMFYNNINSNN
jgi:hypothetical protein